MGKSNSADRERIFGGFRSTINIDKRVVQQRTSMSTNRDSETVVGAGGGTGENKRYAATREGKNESQQARVSPTLRNRFH